jgi:hypothetical protein
MSLQQTALTKAIQILDAIKLPYAIMDGETKYGTLNVTPPKPEKGGKRKSPQFNNVAKFDYEKKLQEATPGTIVSFTSDSSKELDSLRGSVGSFSVRRWGTGSVMTEKKGRTLDVLVIHK